MPWAKLAIYDDNTRVPANISAIFWLRKIAVGDVLIMDSLRKMNEKNMDNLLKGMRDLESAMDVLIANRQTKHANKYDKLMFDLYKIKNRVS